MCYVDVAWVCATWAKHLIVDEALQRRTHPIMLVSVGFCHIFFAHWFLRCRGHERAPYSSLTHKLTLGGWASCSSKLVRMSKHI